LSLKKQKEARQTLVGESLCSRVYSRDGSLTLLRRKRTREGWRGISLLKGGHPVEEAIFDVPGAKPRNTTER